MAQIVRNYKGYTLEITPWGVDVINPDNTMYLATRVTIREAMVVIRWHRRFIRALRLDAPLGLP